MSPTLPRSSCTSTCQLPNCRFVACISLYHTGLTNHASIFYCIIPAGSHLVLFAALGNAYLIMSAVHQAPRLQSSCRGRDVQLHKQSTFHNSNGWHSIRLPSHIRHTASRTTKLSVNSIMSTSTSNPAFTIGKVEEAIYETGRGRGTEVMTLDGTVQKTSLLLGVAVLGASYTWTQVFSGNAATIMAAMGMSKVAGVIGLVAALATMFKPQWSPTTSLVFAASKGIALGAFSSVMELRYPGIVLNTIMLVFGTAASLLTAYQTRLISVTDNFRNGVYMVTGAYMFTLLGTWLLSLVGVKMPGLFSGGIVGIGIGLVGTSLAAASLLLDFDMIRQSARQRMPKWFEWYGGFSLMVTLVWFYTEALRLLSMFANRSD